MPVAQLFLFLARWTSINGSQYCHRQFYRKSVQIGSASICETEPDISPKAYWKRLVATEEKKPLMQRLFSWYASENYFEF